MVGETESVAAGGVDFEGTVVGPERAKLAPNFSLDRSHRCRDGDDQVFAGAPSHCCRLSSGWRVGATSDPPQVVHVR